MEHRYYMVYCSAPNNIPSTGFVSDLGELPLLVEGNIILKLSFGPYKKYQDRDILVDHKSWWVNTPIEEVPPLIRNRTQWKIDSIMPIITKDGAYSHTVLLVSPVEILG